MSNTAALFPGTVDVSGAQANLWTNPNNVKTLDGAYATQVPQGFANNRIMQLTGFGFAIPTDATITGIELILTRRQTGGTTGAVRDDIIQLLKAGVGTGTNLALAADWTGTATAITYGGSASMWGNTLTPANVNATNFGVRFRLYGNGTGSDRQAEIDGATLAIYYTQPSGASGKQWWGSWGA